MPDGCCLNSKLVLGILKRDVKIGLTCQWRRNRGHVQYPELYYRNDEDQENLSFHICSCVCVYLMSFCHLDLVFVFVFCSSRKYSDFCEVSQHNRRIFFCFLTKCVHTHSHTYIFFFLTSKRGPSPVPHLLCHYVGSTQRSFTKMRTALKKKNVVKRLQLGSSAWFLQVVFWKKNIQDEVKNKKAWSVVRFFSLCREVYTLFFKYFKTRPIANLFRQIIPM